MSRGHYPRPSLAQRLAAKTVVDLESGCWNWTGKTNAEGYGIIMSGGIGGGQRLRAHRASYELAKGPIPEGLTLDHLCRNRRCVNPDHLEPVERGVNVLRGESITAQRARATHCEHGHPFDLLNTIFRAGARACRACESEGQRRRYAEKHPGSRGAPAARTHCPKGHPYDEANTYVTKAGARQCRTCHRERERKAA